MATIQVEPQVRLVHHPGGVGEENNPLNALRPEDAWIKSLLIIHRQIEESVRGATGTSLNLLGRSLIPFTIREYRYPVLMGDLSGVDVLIGMDFM